MGKSGTSVDGLTSCNCSSSECTLLRLSRLTKGGRRFSQKFIHSVSSLRIGNPQLKGYIRVMLNFLRGWSQRPEDLHVENFQALFFYVVLQDEKL
jgi:hypothetical protein